MILAKCDSTEVSSIRTFDVSDAELELESNPLSRIVVERVVGDVRDSDAVTRACRDVDVVIHAASIVDFGDKDGDFVRAVNVDGTRTIVDACLATGVTCLVYTSTEDVVITRTPLVDAVETDIYPPESHLIYGSYGVTKQRAEKIVLRANGDNLVTCALRPVVLFGEGDPFNVTNALGVAFRKIVVPVQAENQFSSCYVRNAAWAHVCAFRAALARPEAIGGEAFFVTDDTPTCPYFDFLKPFADGLGYRYAPFKLPGSFLFGLVWLFERLAWIVKTPPMFRSGPMYGAMTTYTFSRQKAEEDLRYWPLYDFQESVRLSLPYYKRVLNA